MKIDAATLNKPAAVDALPFEPREYLARLRLILPIINDAAIALRRQNTDFDADVAYDLIKQACEPLDYEIEQIEFVVASHARRRRQQEAQA